MFSFGTGSINSIAYPKYLSSDKDGGVIEFRVYRYKNKKRGKSEDLPQ